MWRASIRLLDYIENEQKPIIFHLGDHDPSGLDMSRDIQDRLNLFTDNQVEVKRIALSINQVEKFNPPPNFAKITDKRAKEYITRYGKESWELDALTPDILVNLIIEAVESVRDNELWEQSTNRENELKKAMQKEISKMSLD